MKIGIISDTHNNMANFKKALEWLSKQGVKLVLHCGDIQSKETMEEAQNFFKGEIKFCRGNGDYIEDIPLLQEAEAGGKKIGWAHFPAEARKLAKSGKYDLVCYGHTHRAWDEKINNCHMINPGELAGHFYRPTFAVYDTDSGALELKAVDRLES